MNNVSEQSAGYGDLIRTFLRVSLLGFGGPNAHIALMLDEVVDRKGWITRQHFMHLVAATNLLPGPNSSEVAIHIGYTQRGWRGAFATGLAFLLPTLVLVTIFSALYFRYGSLPTVEGVFWGLKPAILAVILSAGWKLGKTALGFPDRIEWPLLLLALAGILVSYFFSGLEVPAMVVGGLLAWVLFKPSSGADQEVGVEQEVGTDQEVGVEQEVGTDQEVGVEQELGVEQEVGTDQEVGVEQELGVEQPEGGSRPGPTLSSIALPFSIPFALPITIQSAVAIGATSTLGALGTLFLMTLGAGAVLFGGGYMLVALIEPFVVGSAGWLTPDQFLDGIALTQAIPGPIVTLVAFVGFSVAGVPGAVVATAGIYIPSFLAVLTIAPHLEKWRKAEGFRAALKGVNAVVAGAILGVGFSLLRPAVPDRWAAGLFLVFVFCLVRFRIQALWVVGGGLLAGILHFLLAG